MMKANFYKFLSSLHKPTNRICLSASRETSLVHTFVSFSNVTTKPYVPQTVCSSTPVLSSCKMCTFTPRRMLSSKASVKEPISRQNVFSSCNKVHIQRHLPTMRPLVSKEMLKQAKRQAAVLVPMCTLDGEPSLLFMVRSMHLTNHRGEVSFPGGMLEEGDKDLVQTALRETYEEIGLLPETVDVWGQLPPLPAKRIEGSVVTPVLGYCGEVDKSKLHLNPEEVADVFTVPIATFCTPANQRQTQWKITGSQDYTIPVFLGGPFRIWGFTAIVLHQVLSVVTPGWYIPQIKHRR